jgi:hypothetical protein
MKTRTFWIIFIKVLGIWLLLNSLTVFPQFASALTFFGANNDETLFGLLAIVGLLLVTLMIYILILRVFLFKTEWIVDKLKLDNEFLEEKFDFNIQSSTVLTMATIVIGGLLFIDSFPLLCEQIFTFFQQESIFRESPNSAWIFFHLIKTIIAYLLVTKSNIVVSYIERKSSDTEDTGKEH